MADDPIRSAMELLDRPVPPDEDFADALFERLVREAGRRPALLPPRTLGRPASNLRRALGVAAVLLLALGLIAWLLGPLRALRSERTPAAPTSATPFVMTVAGRYPASSQTDVPGDFRVRISYAASDRWRIDLLGGSATGQPLIDANVSGAGSYLLRSGDALAAFDAGTGTFVAQPAHAGWFSPLNLLGGLDEHAGWQRACAGGAPLGEDEIAGRPVVGVRCSAGPAFGAPDAHVDVWQDVDTHVILRLESSPEPLRDLPAGPIAWYTGESVTVTSITYDPPLAAGTFDLPSGVPTPAASASPILASSPGDVLPSFTATTLDGRSVDLASTRGTPTVLYFWGDWCPPCIGTPLDALERVSRTRDDVNVVTVAVGMTPASVRAYVDDHGYTSAAVVLDDQHGSTNAWGGPDGVPTFVLLDASGRFVGAYSGWNVEVGTASDVASIVDALVAGSPLPDGFPTFTAHQT
jgi:cytochrome c biogenesis protein CcmG, thiol:disulfide interchange protein DsbE